MWCLGCFYENHIKVSKISQNIPVILFWVKKVVKKGVLRDGKAGFSLEFWEAYLRRFVNFCETKKFDFLNIGKFRP